MPARIFVDQALLAGSELDLPAGAARHVQVLRLQPGANLTLFDGNGGEFAATVRHMGRSEVRVRIGVHEPVERELRPPVTLALGMPANERMDALVEKATELGVSGIQPLLCDRSVLRLSGERALKKVAHWQAVALSACEQSGRTRVPRVAPVRSLTEWLREPPEAGVVRWMLSLREAGPLPATALSAVGVVCLSGPEGGLTPAEEGAAGAAGFVAISLGSRVLRADTAPLAVLAHLGLTVQGRFA
jgi:16S rRNA (uracil1498-N3)-methyltransferase